MADKVRLLSGLSSSLSTLTKVKGQIIFAKDNDKTYIYHDRGTGDSDRVKISAATADKLTTSRTINGTAFDGTASITTSTWGLPRNITVVSNDGSQDAGAVGVDGSDNIELVLPATITAALSGKATSAGTADKLKTGVAINGTTFDGSAAITTANWGTARNISVADATVTNTGEAVSVNGSKAVVLKLPATIKATLSGNASTATSAGKLTNAINIGIVNSDGTGTAVTTSFNGSAAVNLKLPSAIKANITGNVTGNVTGNASTATQATGDGAGRVIAETYFNDVSINGNTLSFFTPSNTTTAKETITLPRTTVVNNLTSTSTTSALSAAQGKALNEAVGLRVLRSEIIGGDNKILSSVLPSYVDDVLEYTAKANFPETGEAGKIYIDTSTNKTYRWGGTAYVEISSSLALGETSSTAYRGDYGKVAYDHATAKGSSFAAGLYKITTNAQGHVTAATAVTKSDITALGIPASDTKYTLPVATTSALGGIKIDDGTGTSTAGAYVELDSQKGIIKNATTSKAGAMSATDKAKLDGIATGAQKNQNAFATVKIGETNLTADTASDVLTITAGSNVTLTPNESGDSFTIAAKDTTYNNATTSTAGLMTAAMVTKLNGIAAGAEVNPNMFTSVTAAGTAITSASKSGVLQFVAGSNVTLTADNTNKKITIVAADQTLYWTEF